MLVAKARLKCSVLQAAELGANDVQSGWQLQRIKRDGLHFHMTFLTKGDLQLLMQSHLADLPAVVWEEVGAHVPDAGDAVAVAGSIVAMLSKMPSCWDWVDVGTGSCKDDKGESVFRVVIWPAAAAVRAKLGLPSKDFHITLGFQGSDVHSKPKSIASLRSSPRNSAFLALQASRLMSAVPASMFSLYDDSLGQLTHAALQGAGSSEALEAEALRVQCLYHGRVKRPNEVLALSERLLHLRPDDGIGIRSQAFALVMLSRHEEAFPLLQHAKRQIEQLPDEEHAIEHARVMKALLHCEKKLGITSSLPLACVDMKSCGGDGGYPRAAKPATKSNYPKTPHLPFSPGVNPDDTRIADCKKLLASEVIITEKLDGGNCCIKAVCGLGLKVFGRTHAQPATHESFSAVKEQAMAIGEELGDVELFGENMQAVHSIEYTNLASYFYAERLHFRIAAVVVVVVGVVSSLLAVVCCC